MAIERNLIHAKMFIYISHILPHINAGRIWICNTTLALVRDDGEGWYAYDGFTRLAEEFSQGEKNGKQVKQVIDNFAEGNWNTKLKKEEKIFFTKLAEETKNKLEDTTCFIYGGLPPGSEVQLNTEDANFTIGLALRRLDELKNDAEGG
jgi:predicted RNA-binding protein with TRAM domain